MSLLRLEVKCGRTWTVSECERVFGGSPRTWGRVWCFSRLAAQRRCFSNTSAFSLGLSSHAGVTSSGPLWTVVSPALLFPG